MQVSDIPLQHLRIGQVVYMPRTGLYAFILSIHAAILSATTAKRPPYTQIAVQDTRGHILEFARVPSNNVKAVSRVIDESEFERFLEIVALESKHWQPLTPEAFAESGSWASNLVRRAAAGPELPVGESPDLGAAPSS